MVFKLCKKFSQNAGDFDFLRFISILALAKAVFIIVIKGLSAICFYGN